MILECGDCVHYSERGWSDRCYYDTGKPKGKSDIPSKYGVVCNNFKQK